MIIELPKDFSFEKEKSGEKAIIEDGILKMTRQTSFRKIMIEISYQMKGKDVCQYCHKKFAKEKMTIDHMFPIDFGGPTISDNLLPACKKCNNEKGNMTYQQYMAFLEAKDVGLEEKYLKTLKKYQELIRKEKRYQIQKSWITERPIGDIFTNINLNEDYRKKKYKSYEEYYLTYGIIKAPIIIDKNGILLDGFLRLMLAKNYNIKSVPVIILENVEVIL
jgi:hypothetical protein